MVPKITDVDWLVTDSEVEALMLECNLIKQFHPRYNIRLKDDKHYPYLCVTTSDVFPRVLIVRRVKQDGNRYFGPYGDATALRENLRIIRRVFRICNCNKKLTGKENDRPCLNYHLGQCDGPCAGKITPEEYRRHIDDVCQFLEGRQDTLAARLEKEMEEASDKLEFERAARLRDQVVSIRKLVERQKAISTDPTDQDVIAISISDRSACAQVLSVRAGKLVGQVHLMLDGAGDEDSAISIGEFIKQYYRDAAFVPKLILVSYEPADREILEQWLTTKHGSGVKIVCPKRGDKRKLVEMAADNAVIAAKREYELKIADTASSAEDLEDLRDILDLSEAPGRIEAYDISNIQGQDAVGSMVVFEEGVSAKAQYRHFKIRTIHQPDDYAMMQEMLKRRFDQAAAGDPKFSMLPDLILIDGGRGHLNAGLEAMAPTGYTIPMISLAKRLEEVYKPDLDEPILLPRDSRALRLLQRVRDEAHRFAIAYHHKLREKSVKRSILDSIPGVGEKRRKALIRQFGSLAGVRQASMDEILTVPGMTRTVAQAIYDSLHPDHASIVNNAG
jgi:excinuclease ABC subunit C